MHLSVCGAGAGTACSVCICVSAKSEREPIIDIKQNNCMKILTNLSFQGGYDVVMHNIHSCATPNKYVWH